MDKRFKIVFGIILLFFCVMIFGIFSYAKYNIENNNLNKLKKDISLLEEKIALYYLDNNSLPIKDKEIEFSKNMYNPNDGELYYEIDLSLLDNINLSFGMKQKNKNDYYIINVNSHTVYYFKGIKYKKDIFYTNEEVKYTYIDLEKYK